MEETINVIETAIQDKKEYIRRLNEEREMFIKGISDNFSNRISAEKTITELEVNLKEIYDLTYNKKENCDFNKYNKNTSSAIMTSEGRAKDINIGSQNVQKG